MLFVFFSILAHQLFKNDKNSKELCKPPILTLPLQPFLCCGKDQASQKKNGSQERPKGFEMEPGSEKQATEVEKIVYICLFQAVVITKYV